jgi:hypothetical protein
MVCQLPALQIRLKKNKNTNENESETSSDAELCFMCTYIRPVNDRLGRWALEDRIQDLQGLMRGCQSFR